MTDTPTKQARQPLTRDRVLAEAVAFADEDGIGSVSMRKLATRLGFEVMSLYNHVANKRDLQQGMVDLVTKEVPLPADPSDWRAALRQHAIDSKNMFLRHPWAVMLWVTTVPGEARFDQMEWKLRTLGGSDLDEVAAHHAFHAIMTHVTGYSLQATLMLPDEDDALAVNLADTLDADRYPQVIAHIQQHIDGAHGPSFEFVLDLLLDGIAALDAAASASSP